MSPLPTPLIDYLEASPLPTFAFDPSQTSSSLLPVYSNGAATDLLNGKQLNESLEGGEKDKLSQWLVGDRAAEKGVLEELEVHLAAVGAPPHYTPPTLRLRKSIIESFIFLTVLPPLPSATENEQEVSSPLIMSPPISQVSQMKRQQSSGTWNTQGAENAAEDAPVGLFRMDAKLKVIWTNRKWWEVTRLDRTTSPDDWVERVRPEDAPMLSNSFKALKADPIPTTLEFRWKHYTHPTETCYCSIEVERSYSGTPTGYVGSFQEIIKEVGVRPQPRSRQSDFNRSRSTLSAQQESELALLSRFSAVGLAQMDINGSILSVNDSWHNIMQLGTDADLDSWTNLLDEDDKGRVEKEWVAAMSTLKPVEVRYKMKDGRVLWGQATPNHIDTSKVTGWIGSVTDISKQAKAESTLLQVSHEREALARREAEEAEARRLKAVEEKTQQELLVDITSHELRNPISAILQNSEVTKTSIQHIADTLKKTAPELFDKLQSEFEDDYEALDSISECAMAQERIANDILGLAQLQLKRYNITPIPFELLASLRNTIKMFKNEANSHKIKLDLFLGASLRRLGPKARVHADPTRLAQILINLLSNAIRFTSKSPNPDRRVSLSVEVSAIPPDRDGELIPPPEVEYKIEESAPIYLFFSVADTGPGMTEEETTKLFKKFSQASPLTHSTYGGSGLGLWIARNLCELQMGRVEVKSVVGQGSTFRCFIAARSVDGGSMEISDDESAKAVAEAVTATNHAIDPLNNAPPVKKNVDPLPTHHLTILYCEDNKINRTVLKRQLNKEGHEVILAEDGQKGLDALAETREKPIDAILMDIEMPVMDGLTATRSIRTAEVASGMKRIRIVGLTGNARPEQIQTALDAGMDRVLTKPYRLQVLLDELQGFTPSESNDSMPKNRVVDL